MSRSARLAEAAAEFIDLDLVPFTLPGSRLLVRLGADGDVTVQRAEYEVDPDDSVVVRSVHLLNSAGRRLPVSRVRIDRIEFGDGDAVLTFAGVDALTLSGPGPAEVQLEYPDGRVASHIGGALRLTVGTDRSVSAETEPDFAGRLAGTASVWSEWFDRCPAVDPTLEAVVAHCWWVLGANQIEIDLVPRSRAVAPSKLGYVALWQWDAYFIAIGLRHGALQLAQEQLELALRFPEPDGQLPDVLHDRGILSSSDDLPPADLARLRELGSPAADPGERVPLTKPPLAALALARLVDSGASLEWLAAMVPTVRASQQWWLDHCVAADGLPEYDHPYSSGLDDSPVFDTDLPMATPDLAGYLAVQDRQLADLLTRLGDGTAAARHRARAAESELALSRLWDAEKGRFVARGAHGPVAGHTVVDLLPLLTGTLPDDVADVLVAELSDPEAFGTPFPVPTVAVDDPAFNGDRMWRGPVWVNTNWLLIEGLLASGYAAQAVRLAHRTLAMVAAAGGAFEYYHPDTGLRAGRAAPAFAWTAALVIDLAVRFGADPHLTAPRPNPVF